MVYSILVLCQLAYPKDTLKRYMLRQDHTHILPRRYLTHSFIIRLLTDRAYLHISLPKLQHIMGRLHHHMAQSLDRSHLE